MKRKYCVVGLITIVVIGLTMIAFAPKIEAVALETIKAEDSGVSGNILEPVYFTIDTSDEENGASVFSHPFIRIINKAGEVKQKNRDTQVERVHEKLGVYKVRITEGNNTVIYSSDYMNQDSITVKLKRNRIYEGVIYRHIDVCVYNDTETGDEGTQLWKFSGFKTIPSFAIQSNGCKVTQLNYE